MGSRHSWYCRFNISAVAQAEGTAKSGPVEIMYNHSAATEAVVILTNEEGEVAKRHLPFLAERKNSKVF